MRRTLMTLVLGLALAPLAFAHEGHVHKVMGTVAVLHENHLEVKATDGKTATVTLNDKTKVLRGKAQTTVADIRVGERVVVTAAQTRGKDGKTSLIAKQINLSTASTNPR